MKKIGQITFFRTLYGAILQCAALQKFCRSCGYECEVINYSALGLRRRKPLLMRMISSVLEFAEKNIFTRKRNENTRFFQQKHIQKSNFFQREQELTQAVGYDIYVAGSDQIWNPRNNNNSGAYFLNFVPAGRKCIAYAPSFGLSELPQPYAERCAEWLKKFDVLSCREEAGAAIIERLTGKKVPIVLDPTFLIAPEEWRTMQSSKKYPAGYILCYQVGANPQLRHALEQTAVYWAKKRNLRIIWIGRPGYMRLKHPFAEGWDAGPAEFLRLIDDADMIVTNSFHGLAFSLIFHKEFWIVSRTINSRTEAALDSRQRNLLAQVGLLSRLVTADTKMNGAVENIDYNEVEEKLSQSRKASQEFLKKAFADE